ncbi:Ankyrin repeat family protein [Melia azedarach]|uniref:Ankyrin repeat family protein n=1 Tax=Melia azedarach TaxID=155640 RepID=A0ACC1Y3B5_MELAZ|nr:Ankyrin repeat family protein [Melia azedarach]
MERMESILYDAAVRGGVPTLLELLQQDPLILDRVILNCLSETPLHVAVMLGHADFVKEILCRKPEFADELDSRQSSALHIASQKGYVEIVQALLQANPEMCFARDVNGRNPLHLAAMKGRIEVLRELLKTRPLAASATTIFGETILHLCVKFNQLEVLKFLLETMDDPEFLNAKDDYGMTILHVAVADKQIEVIKFLTTRTKINVNALNANGFTALDILAQSKRDVKDWEIGESIRRAGAISVKDNNDIHLSVQELGTRQTNRLTSSENNKKQRGKASKSFPEKEDDWLDKKRNALMVVASLIATMAFQAGVNPPKSPLQDSSSPDNSRPAAAPVHRSPTLGLIFISQGFYTYNTIGFLASMSIILLLISGLPLNHRIWMWILSAILWVAISSMVLTYMAAILIIEETENLFSNAASAIIVVWMIIEGIIYLWHILRLILRMIKYFRKSFRIKGRSDLG